MWQHIIRIWCRLCEQRERNPGSEWCARCLGDLDAMLKDEGQGH